MSLNVLVANAHLATKGLQATAALVPLGDEVAKLAATSLDDVATRLGSLVGRDAQVLIGPRVNFGQTAMQRVMALASQAHTGHMPVQSAFDDALGAVAQLTRSLPGPIL